jgi:hypothetical protein
MHVHRRERRPGNDTERSALVNREEAERALEAPARKRLEAKERLRLADLELKPYVKQARKAGVPLRTIAQKTGLSQNTISLWEAR